MTRATDWLDGYLTAWRTKDPDDVRAIFAEDAEYLFQPDARPVVGREAIATMWVEEDEPAVAVPDLRVLIENDDVAIITGQVDYPGHQLYLNMWEVWFAPDGTAKRFVEWYMTPRGPADGDADGA